MGDSLPPSTAIDLVDSYARRRGSDAEIVLARPPEPWLSGVRVEVVQGSRVVPAEVAESSATRLVLRVPRARLADGTWGLRLTLTGADGSGDTTSSSTLDARLLVQGDRPLVLLWGAKASPSIEPLPTSPRTKQVASAGGRVLDRALSVLPDDRARQVRGRIRRVARRALAR